MSDQPLLGVVLCGGQSRRMGTDKGLIRDAQTGMTWVEMTGATLAATGINVVYSINESQLPAYLSILPDARLIVDAIDIPGPLKGMISVHKLFPERDLLIVACDLPGMNTITLAALVSAYNGHQQASAVNGESNPVPRPDFYYYKLGSIKETLCCIYRKEALAKISSHWSEGILQDFSLKHLLADERSFILEVASDEVFKNANTPGEV